MGKKSIFSTWGTDPVADTTAPAFRPQTIEPTDEPETIEVTQGEYAALVTAQDVYQVLNQIKILLFAILILKLLCLIKN